MLATLFFVANSAVHINYYQELRVRASRSNILFSSITITCFLFLSLTVCCGTPEPEDEKEKFVAIIEGKKITVRMLDTYLFKNLNGIFALGFLKELEQKDQDANRVKSRLFEDFLDAQLLLGEAAKAGITVSDEEVQEFMEAFGEQAGEKDRIESNSFALTKDLLIVQKFKTEKLVPRVMVGDSEVKKYYDEQKLEMQESQKVTLSIINFETEDEAEEAIKQIKRGKEKFETIMEKQAPGTQIAEAQTYSIEDLPEDIQTEVKRLKVDQVSNAVPLLGQFCIFKVERRAKEGMKPFEEVAGSIREKLFREKFQAMLERYMNELKERSDVQIFYENLPFTFVREGT